MARRRRRSTLSFSSNQPRRTPSLVYIILALLCVGGLFYSKQNLVKTVTGKVLDAYSGQPMVGASVTLNNDRAQAHTAGIPDFHKTSTDNNGLFEFNQSTESYNLSVQFNNYRAVQLKQTGVYTQEVKLVPTLLRGQVKDEGGQGVPRALITLNNKTVETGAEGGFSFADAPESGTLSVRASGYRRTSLNFEKTVEVSVALQAFRVKAAYLAPADIAGPSTFNSIMTSLAPTQLTAVVIDLKDESGKVLFDSKSPVASSALAGPDKRIPNLTNLMKTFKDRKLYTIARIVCFQDPLLTDIKPEWTLKSRSSAKAWVDGSGFNWINPYQREAWEYYLGLADEAAKAGFDEVQFAGLHFPILGKLDDIDYALPEGRTSNATTRMEAVNGFLKAARDRLAPQGVYTSINVLGSALVEGGDLGIGMNLAAMVGQVDYISPMIYPIEWQPGAFGIDQPAAKPYELVRQAMLSAGSVLRDRITQVRPWLQDFSRNNVAFGESQVRDEIRAVEEAQKNGGSGWVLYNPASRYSVGAIGNR